MHFCSRCGKRILEETARFCSGCGNEIRPGQVVASSSILGPNASSSPVVQMLNQASASGSRPRPNSSAVASSSSPRPVISFEDFRKRKEEERRGSFLVTRKANL